MENNNNLVIEGISELGSRIADVAALVGGKKALSKLTSISESQLYRYISGQSQPTALPLAAIAKAGNIDLDWLITGRGNLFISMKAQPGANISIHKNPQQLVEIPYYLSNEDSDQAPEERMGKFAFRADWLLENKLTIDALRLLHAYGDSMETTINDGDLLMIDTSQTEVIGDAIFAIRLDGHLIIKRLQHAVDSGIYISSDNPFYREQHVPIDQIDKLKIVGRIVWSAGKI